MIQPFSPWYVDLLMYLPNHVPEWTVLFLVGFVSGRWIARNPVLVALAFWLGSTGYDFINYAVRSIPDIAEDPRILVIFPGPLLGIVLLWLGVQVGKRKSGRNQQPSFAVIKDTLS